MLMDLKRAVSTRCFFSKAYFSLSEVKYFIPVGVGNSVFFSDF